MTNVGNTENLFVYRHEDGDFRVESLSPGPYVEGRCWIHVPKDVAPEVAAKLREIQDDPSGCDTLFAGGRISALQFMRYEAEQWIQLDEWGRGDTWRLDRRGTVQFRWSEAKELSLLLERPTQGGSK